MYRNVMKTYLDIINTFPPKFDIEINQNKSQSIRQSYVHQECQTDVTSMDSNGSDTHSVSVDLSKKLPSPSTNEADVNRRLLFENHWKTLQQRKVKKMLELNKNLLAKMDKISAKMNLNTPKISRAKNLVQFNETSKPKIKNRHKNNTARVQKFPWRY